MQVGRWAQRALVVSAAAGLGYAIRGESEPRTVGDGIEHAPDPVIEVDALGRITVFNRAAERISGDNRSGACGRHFTAVGILAISSYPLALQHFALAVAGFDPRPAELTIHTKDGRAVVVEGNARARRFAGVMRSMQVAFRDTTERHGAATGVEAAHELAERERRRFLSLTESMSSGLLLADPDGKLAYCNPRLTDFTGVPPELTIGRPLGVLARVMSRRLVDPGRFAQEFTEARETLERHPAFDIEVFGDARRIYEISCFPVIDVWRKGPGFGSIVRDVTQARELDFRKTEFISIASHELRTPLTGILGFSQLLNEQTDLNGPSRDWAGRIAGEAERLSAIADQLLDVSRIDSGTSALELSEVDLTEELEDILSHFEPRATATRHRIVTNLESDIRAAVDRSKLREVIINLVDNALKYSPAGGTLSLVSEADDSWIMVSVSDDGIGIPPTELPHVFGRFRRGQHRDTATIRGAGRGLYVVDAFVRSMGGPVSAESEAGSGSTFTVVLPRVDSAIAALQPDFPRGVVSRDGSAATSQQANDETLACVTGGHRRCSDMGEHRESVSPMTEAAVLWRLDLAPLGVWRRSLDRPEIRYSLRSHLAAETPQPICRAHGAPW